jgi:hypothetical protein
MKVIVSNDKTERTITIYAKGISHLSRKDAIIFAEGWLTGRGENEGWAFSTTKRLNQNFVDVGFRRVGKEGR